MLYSPDPVQGGLWLGFFQGGVAYFKDGQVRASYAAADGLGEGRVNGLQLDRDGTLWAATEGGLSRVKNGRVATLTSRNGLPCDAVHWVMEDDDHSFWLYMACGLVRIARPELDAWAADPKRTIQTTVFDSSDGVRSHATASGYSPRVAKSTDGKLWFLPSTASASSIRVTFPSTNSRRRCTSSKSPPTARPTMRIASNLRLPALSRDLEIDYTALSLVAPEKVHFRYKLEGHDRDWKDVGNRPARRSIPIFLHATTASASSPAITAACGTRPATRSISPSPRRTIRPPGSARRAWPLFWHCSGRCTGYRLHQIAREFNARLEERVDERTRIARELHDTLLQSFQGLMLRFQAVDQPASAGQRRKEALEKALDRARPGDHRGRDAVQDLRSSTVLTNDLAQAVHAWARNWPIRRIAEGRHRVPVVVEGAPRELHPILRDEIYRIAGEALRNAFRHAQARRIEVEIRMANGRSGCGSGTMARHRSGSGGGRARRTFWFAGNARARASDRRRS